MKTTPPPRTAADASVSLPEFQYDLHCLQSSGHYFPFSLFISRFDCSYMSCLFALAFLDLHWSCVLGLILSAAVFDLRFLVIIMDRSWMSEPRSSTPFLKGVGEFLDFEFRKNGNEIGEMKCLCVNCFCKLWVTRETTLQHIICNGIMEGYNNHHLEVGKEVAQVGIWGTKSKGSPHNHWSFRLANNHKLKKITIDHGDLIYSLKFSTEDDRGSFHDSEKVGGWNGGNEECEVKSKENKLFLC
ncbi:hypothetical protein SSX86_015898 [Deinandra increscens subsp. villosa]|uniref:Uncharacterized protein n=1 Tax=Deinandra increscens subsp. villosa TaxID=3103831 RepID=A0AAP0GWM9_9ASTR